MGFLTDFPSFLADKVFGFPQGLADKVHSFPQGLADNVFRFSSNDSYINFRSINDEFSPNYYLNSGVEGAGSGAGGSVFWILGIFFILFLLFKRK